MKPVEVMDKELARAASEWLLRLRAPAVTSEEISAWLAWYEADARHRQVYDDIRAFWGNADALASDMEFIAGVEREIAEGSRGAPSRPMYWRPAQSPRWILPVAAGILIALGVGLFMRSGSNQGDEIAMTLQGPQAFSSAAPTKRAAPELSKDAYLPDGSQVALAEKSSVAVSYTRSKRLLVMDKGVAFFTVAHNTQRPFLVKVGKFYVRAVGTAFNVRSTNGRLVVTVTQGAVDVYPIEKSSDGDVPKAGYARAEAGKELVWADEVVAPTIERVDVSHALAWQKGVLEYFNEPLGAAIDDINRYSSRTIVINDPTLKDIVFSGTVFTDSIDGWVHALPNLFPVQVSTDASGNMVINRRPA